MTLVSDARAIAVAGVHAADPARAVRSCLRRVGGQLELRGRPVAPAVRGQLHLIAIGKAGAALFEAAAAVVSSDPPGLVITPRGYPAPRARRTAVYGDHPVPGPASFRAGRRLLEYVREIPETDSVLYLLSGGGSAVAEVPAGGLAPEEITATTRELLASGAAIGEMNAIRRHLSAIKGGQLALASDVRWFGTIAISDVVGDPPADIASGPTVADPSTFADALRVVEARRLRPRLPPRVVRHLEAGRRGEVPETPKPPDPRLRRAPFVIAASNRIALRAAAQAAFRRGYSVRLGSSRMTGETRPVAERFARVLVGRRSARSFALLGGGETTVTLGRRAGRGGRNQEFALAAVPILEGREAVVLSIGTDGIDGPTDAAGGWADGRSAVRARALGVDVRRSLDRHASYAALARLRTLLRTGPTGTNVMDLHVGLAKGRG